MDELGQAPLVRADCKHTQVNTNPRDAASQQPFLENETNYSGGGGAANHHIDDGSDHSFCGNSAGENEENETNYSGGNATHDDDVSDHTASGGREAGDNSSHDSSSSLILSQKRRNPRRKLASEKANGSTSSSTTSSSDDDTLGTSGSSSNPRSENTPPQRAKLADLGDGESSRVGVTRESKKRKKKKRKKAKGKKLKKSRSLDLVEEFTMAHVAENLVVIMKAMNLGTPKKGPEASVQESSAVATVMQLGPFLKQAYFYNLLFVLGMSLICCSVRTPLLIS
jgi:hypothetical protein